MTTNRVRHRYWNDDISDEENWKPYLGEAVPVFTYRELVRRINEDNNSSSSSSGSSSSNQGHDNERMKSIVLTLCEDGSYDRNGSPYIGYGLGGRNGRQHMGYQSFLEAWNQNDSIRRLHIVANDYTRFIDEELLRAILDRPHPIHALQLYRCLGPGHDPRSTLMRSLGRYLEQTDNNELRRLVLIPVNPFSIFCYGPNYDPPLPILQAIKVNTSLRELKIYFRCVSYDGICDAVKCNTGLQNLVVEYICTCDNYSDCFRRSFERMDACLKNYNHTLLHLSMLRRWWNPNKNRLEGGEMPIPESLERLLERNREIRSFCDFIEAQVPHLVEPLNKLMVHPRFLNDFKDKPLLPLIYLFCE